MLKKYLVAPAVGMAMFVGLTWLIEWEIAFGQGFRRDVVMGAIAGMLSVTLARWINRQRRKPRPLLVYAVSERQAIDAAAAINDLRPGSAMIAFGDVAPFLADWHAGKFPVLVTSYRLCTGFRAPSNASVMLLDGCPSAGHRIQCAGRVNRFSKGTP